MPVTKTRSYVICSAPRSGSTLLCYLLAGTGKTGRPDSYFRHQSISYWANRLNVALPQSACGPQINSAYVQAVRRQGTGGTGCFGLRLMGENLNGLMDGLKRIYPGLPGDTARIDRAFGKTRFIHLTRKDKAAQAVSLLKAEQTGLWHKGADGQELERTSPHRAPVYDRQRLDQIIAMFERLDAAWAHWFGKHRLTPVPVTYERLSAAPGPVFADLLLALGFDPQLAADAKPATARLADDTSARWLQRYKAETSSD